MPLPPGVARWTVEGTSTAEEVWAFDFWTQVGTGVGSQDQWEEITDDYRSLMQNGPLDEGLASLIPTTGAITALRSLYYRNAQTAEYSAISVLSPAKAGTSTFRAPLTTSFCVTTLTGRPGGSYRGRMYLPAAGMPLDASHRFTAGSMTTIVQALATWMGAGHTVGQYGIPVVVSRTLGVATPITALRYDNKPDTQRRRANRQAAGPRVVVPVGAA